MSRVIFGMYLGKILETLYFIIFIVCYYVLTIVFWMDNQELILTFAPLWTLFICFINPLSPHDALKNNFISLKRRIFPTTKGFRRDIYTKLDYQYT